MAYIAICGYYWFIWALYKDACGAPVGEWLYLWYKNAKAFGKKAKRVEERLATLKNARMAQQEIRVAYAKQNSSVDVVSRGVVYFEQRMP